MWRESSSATTADASLLRSRDEDNTPVGSLQLGGGDVEDLGMGVASIKERDNFSLSTYSRKQVVLRKRTRKAERERWRRHSIRD